MKDRALIAIATIATIATAMLHAYSYLGEIPRAWFVAEMTLAMTLFVLLFGSTLWTMRGQKLPDALNGYWRAVMAAAPKPIRFLSLLAWIAAVVPFARTIITGSPHLMEFHTGWCFCVSLMALSFVTGIRRLRLREAQPAP